MVINPIMSKERRSPKKLTEIKQVKISNQIIMSPRVPRYPILNPPEKQLYK